MYPLGAFVRPPHPALSPAGERAARMCTDRQATMIWAWAVW